MALSSGIQWPGHNRPQNYLIHVRNELDIDVTPERLWVWFPYVTLWPTWDEYTANVSILNGAGSSIDMGSNFSWRTMGITIKCAVVAYVVNERSAWSETTGSMALTAIRYGFEHNEKTVAV